VSGGFPTYCSVSGWCGALNRFAAVWGSAPDAVWVAGNDRELYAQNSFSRFDGESWVNHDQHREGWGRVTAIGGSSAEDVWFVGEDQGNGWVQHFDGSTFSPVMYPGAEELRAVWGHSRRDVWAVGVQGYTLHFDGDSWSDESSTTLTNDLNAVWGTGSDNVLAVGSKGAVARWNGATWELERSDPGPELFGVWGPSADDVWVVGADATVLRFDGKAWTESSLGIDALGGVELVAVSGSGASDVWIAEREGRLIHWDGRAFSVTPTSSQGLSSLWVAASGEAWALGERGFAARCDDAGCVERRPVLDDHLYAAWGSAADDVWAVGARGSIAHFDGSAWTHVESPTTATLRSVSGSSRSAVWAVGDAILRFDGESWSIANESSALEAVFALSDDDVWAVGDDAALLHFDGTDWVDFQTDDPTRHFTGVWGSARDDVWVVGIGNVNLHYDGSGWSKVPTPANIAFNRQTITGTARDNVFIHGWYLQIGQPHFGEGRWNGQEWSFNGGDYGALLTSFGRPSAFAASPREVWLVTGHGSGSSEIYRLSSSLWGEGSGTDFALYGLWGSSPEDIWAVGENGTILHKEFALETPM
jgi:hypothetical protein